MIGIGAALIAVMYAIIKNLGSKVDKLEYEKKVSNKLKEIRNDQDEFKEKVLSDEKTIINKKVKIDSDQSIRDELNGL